MEAGVEGRFGTGGDGLVESEWRDAISGCVVMATAHYQGTLIASAESTIVVEGNHYFPPDGVKWEYFSENDRTTTCPWKGDASYYDLSVDGVEAKSVAWTYHRPEEAAAEIRDHVAFYPQVEISS